MEGGGGGAYGKRMEHEGGVSNLRDWNKILKGKSD